MNIVKKNDKPIGAVLKDLVNKNEHLKKGLARVKIEEIYRSQMGEVINNYTEKIFLRNGKLYITIVSAPLRMEMQKSKAKLIKIINDSLGTAVVEEIIIK